jgi:hypothetical protein
MVLHRPFESARIIGDLKLTWTVSAFFSNDADRCKRFFCTLLLASSTLLHGAGIASVLESLFIWLHPKLLSPCVHQFGVAHQSSLRSRTTMMSFSISPFREAGSLINQPVTLHHNALLASPHRHHHFSAASVHDDRTRCTRYDLAT